MVCFRRRILAVFVLLSASWVLGSHAQWPPANPSYQTGFPVQFADGDIVRYSSVALADLNSDGFLDIVVGGNDGKLQAYEGDGTMLWEFDTGDAAIESKAAIGDIDGDSFPEVVVGVGSTFTVDSGGGLFVLSHTGALQCSFVTGDVRPADGKPDAVFSSPAIADLDGNDGGLLEIAFGSWDHHVRVINHDCTLVWEDNVRDTVWSSASIADLDKDGEPEVIIGVDSHAEGPPFNTTDGGRLHVYRADGQSELPGFPIQLSEVISSTPAIGDLDGDGFLDIVVGTGHCWAATTGCAPELYPGVDQWIYAFDRFGNALPGWPFFVSGQYTRASPSLVDLDDDGDLEVIINTRTDDESYINVIEGDGSIRPGWPTQPITPSDCQGGTVSFGTRASPIVGDVNNDGLLEVILPSNKEVVIWDRDGSQLSRSALTTCPEPPGVFVLRAGFSVAGAPALGDLDNDGDVELIAAAGANATAGAIFVWDFPGPADAASLPWPAFRRTANNHALVVLTGIFSDGFESGDISSW